MVSVKDVKIANQRVLLKIAGDVPMENGRVTDDYRLQVSLPTINYLLKNQAAKIIILAHLGRPQGRVVDELKMAPVAERLAELLKMDWRPAGGGYEIGGKIQFLENIRFDSREEKNDGGLARQWAALADIFVQEGFADCHRRQTSVVAITTLLPSYAGLNLQREIEELNRFNKPRPPVAVIIGGAKIADKMPLVKVFSQRGATVLVGGLVAAKLKTKRRNGKIILPVDGVVDETREWRDIGRGTIKEFSRYLILAKTILWAGCLGKIEDERFCYGGREVARAIGRSLAGVKIAAGGDTVGFIRRERLENNFTFLSSGGGATLRYLAGENLPGIEALTKIKS